MDFYRTHQNDIRGDYLAGLYDEMSRGDRDGSQAGSRIILPPHLLEVQDICIATTRMHWQFAECSVIHGFL